jgi:mannose-6-phosphate isomerase-like protein (cupin superfamily)
MSKISVTEEDLKVYREAEPQLLNLRTPLVSSGMTQRLLTRGENSTLRILCYAPSRGEDHGLHGHIEEEHYFIVLHGAAQFYGLKGPLPQLQKNQGIFLPKGCFYEFYNPTEEPLVVLRIGASEQKVDRGVRLTPEGEPIPGRSTRHGEAMAPVFIESAFFE